MCDVCVCVCCVCVCCVCACVRVSLHTYMHMGQTQRLSEIAMVEQGRINKHSRVNEVI